MDTESILAAYRDAITQRGEAITIKRGTTTVTVNAVVTAFQPNEMVGDVRQGDRKAIILGADLTDANFPLPLRKGDKAVIRGNEMNIEDADDSTVRVAGTLIAVIVRVRGRP